MTKQWNEYREVIIGQYKHQNKPLHEVQRIMEEKFKFKASTRAYRSRFDKWKVYKYSCRKRRDSIGGRSSEKESSSSSSSNNSEEGGFSPASLSLGSPVMTTSANRSPPTMCTESTSSPDMSGSPLMKFESRSQYERMTGPLHSMSNLPSPPNLAQHDPFRFHHNHHFDQQYHYLGASSSQISNDTGGGPEYYRAGCHERDHHENIYDPDDQSPTPSPPDHHIRGMSIDGLPTIQQNGPFSQLHSPTTMGYNYPIPPFLKAPRD